MKITKQRLKEIIREELTAEGSREDMMMPALSQADFDAAMATDEPRHEGGTPMERLLNKLLIVSNIGAGEGGAAAARKLGLAGDKEVEAYLDDLLGNQMYKESGLEESDEMELEEYRGGADAAQSQKRMRNYRGGDTRSANQGSRSSSSEAEQSQQRMQNYRGGSNKSPYGSSR